jgi:hypothetical protein
MKSVSLQFHALPEELPGLFLDLFLNEAVYVTAAFEHSLSKRELEFRKWAETPAEILGNGLQAICFSLDPLNLLAPNLYQFRLLNPNALTLVIGELSESGLAESWVSAMTDDEVAIQLWRKAIKKLKAKMLSGAIAIDPVTGATAPMKWHKFTQLAQHRFDKGLKLLPVAGNAIIKLPIASLTPP